jgi:hypothetical protein
MSYEVILHKMIAKIIRECFQTYPEIDFLSELDRFVGFEQMGFDTGIYDQLLNKKSENFRSKLDLEIPQERRIYKKLGSSDGLVSISEENNFYGAHARALLEQIDQELDIWNRNVKSFLMRDATPNQVLSFAKGLSKYFKSFGKYQSDAMKAYIECLKPKLNFMVNRLGVPISLINDII